MPAPPLNAPSDQPAPSTSPGNDPGLAGLIGQAPVMVRLRDQIRRVAPTQATVLIIGESGTGKEAVAQALHTLSTRAKGPFVAVNCGAIAASLIEAELLGHEKGSFTGADRQRAGYFERANGGTIFLDEVTEMPLEMQVKLLRVLESRRFQRVGGSETISADVRVVAATNRDIEASVREGRFREDLMYRLAVFPLRVPSLRERDGDVPVLAQHFLDGLNAKEGSKKTFSRPYLRQLQMQQWSGNVRELKNTVSRAFILADELLDLPTIPAAAAPRKPTRRDGHLLISIGTPLADAEREMILATLEHFSGDKRQTAQTLGVSLKTLYNRLEAYRIEATGPDSSNVS